jgi:predicted membrane-bound spermidine synthase
VNRAKQTFLFAVFFVSGFSGLAYQVIWTRMAFASFGIITPVLSVVLSVYMLGLSVGSWAGGALIGGWVRKTGKSALFFYSVAEAIIGLGAFVVPQLFHAASHILWSTGEMNSGTYLAASALALGITILPWCFCMGTTFPFMMAHIRETEAAEEQSFSFLYLANVLGAMFGCLVTALILVEVMGFAHSLWVAALGNFAIALACGALSLRPKPATLESVEKPAGDAPRSIGLGTIPTRGLAWILFTTGFAAMAMEVVWTRAFCPVLQTQVYSFALIVFTYLGATFAGSWLYRRHVKMGNVWPSSYLMAMLLATVTLPVLLNDSRLAPPAVFGHKLRSASIVLASIIPFCAALGYLTPRLIDERSRGNPKAAGRAYAVNVVGCILGPLFASYVLLPWVKENYALLILSAPLAVCFLMNWESLPGTWRVGSVLLGTATFAWSLFGAHDFEDLVGSFHVPSEARRDYAASVIAYGDSNRNKVIYVNGIGMTIMTPITKFMVHLPLTLHEGPAESALIICFGMGTSFRSALSWGLDTTAVELVPSVPKEFGFFHTNAAEVLRNPKGRIVIDDGRRFLERTTAQYDLIVIDPPPPVEAAGSSLLYSTGFYDAAKARLKKHGLLATWFPMGDPLTALAIYRSLRESFSEVHCYQGVAGWGMHFVASMDPIPAQTVAQMAARMPATAKNDLLEWYPEGNATEYLSRVVMKEYGSPDLTQSNPRIVITDDHPFNEYYFLRQMGWLKY